MCLASWTLLASLKVSGNQRSPAHMSRPRLKVPINAAFLLLVSLYLLLSFLTIGDNHLDHWNVTFKTALNSVIWHNVFLSTQRFATASFPLKDHHAHSRASVTWLLSGKERNRITDTFTYSSPFPTTEDILLVQWFSNWGLRTSSSIITCKLVRNAHSQAPPQIYGIRNSGSGAQKSVLSQVFQWLWGFQTFVTSYSALHLRVPRACTGKPSRSLQKA